MDYGNLTCVPPNNWMLPSIPGPWTKTADGPVRGTEPYVTTSKSNDIYESGVISSSSPPSVVPDGSQDQSRLRRLLTRGPAKRNTRQGKKILKGLLKGQQATTNTEGNFLLKGLLNTGVMQQDVHLLSSLGFGNIRSPPASHPGSNSPGNTASPDFSPMSDISPQSCSSPSPAGSSKRGGDDDIYGEHLGAKKTRLSPPSFVSLPSSAPPDPPAKDATTGSAICEKNKMLASLLATQPTTPVTIPPMPHSVITATPQERLSSIPGLTRFKSSASYCGGTIQLIEPPNPPVVPLPNLEQYLLPLSLEALGLPRKETYPGIALPLGNMTPVSMGSLAPQHNKETCQISPPVTSAQHPKETYPGIALPLGNMTPVSMGSLAPQHNKETYQISPPVTSAQHPKETYPGMTPQVSAGSVAPQRPKETYPVITPPVTPAQHPKETYPRITPPNSTAKVPSPITISSSPESENTFPVTQPINHQIMDQRSAVNQQRLYPCNQGAAWPNFCRQENQLPATGVQDSSAWQNQIAVNQKRPCQKQEAYINSYNPVPTSLYNSNYFSCDYYNQLQMRQNHNSGTGQEFLMQQQIMLQQRSLNHYNYQQRYCAQSKEYYSLQSQHVAGWNNYPREQPAYNGFQEKKQSEVSMPNVRGSNYQESRNSYQEYWDMQHSGPVLQSVTNSVEYQNGGQTNIDRQGVRDTWTNSSVQSVQSVESVQQQPPTTKESQDVPSKSQTICNDCPQEIALKSFNPNEELPVFLPNDSDLSRILDDLLDVENTDKWPGFAPSTAKNTTCAL